MDRRPIARDIAESLGKLPPKDEQMEEAVLGALLTSKNAIVEIGGVLKPEHLYSEQHKEIYQAILDLFSEGAPIDLRSVVARLKTNGKLELVGGAFRLAEISSRVSTAANVEYHSRILIELAIKRALIQIASEVHHDAYEDTTDVFELYAKLNMKLQQVLDNAISNRAEKSVKDLQFQYVKEYQAKKSGGKQGGIPSGFPNLDRLLGGLHETNLIILAARPAMGKSVLALQIGKQVAEQDIPVGVFSLEMSGVELVGRLNIAESEINADKVKSTTLDNYEFSRLMDGIGVLSNLKMWIDDTPSLNIVELRARAIRMKTKYGIRVLIVDYLQLVKGTEHGKYGVNRDQEIGIITRTLKGIAKELNICVIALSQLSRAVETRGGDKRPTLSDLRESGSIEQDSDIVAFLYRPEYYKITVTDTGENTHGLAEIIIAKHRNGDLDTVKQKFIGKHQKFTEWIGGGYSGPRPNEYAEKHYKNPLPSERTPEQLGETEEPF